MVMPYILCCWADIRLFAVYVVVDNSKNLLILYRFIVIALRKQGSSYQ